MKYIVAGKAFHTLPAATAHATAIFEQSGIVAGIEELRCNMEANCNAPVTHIDECGFVYCLKHGNMRKARYRCRKLKPSELARLLRGEQVQKY